MVSVKEIEGAIGGGRAKVEVEVEGAVGGAPLEVAQRRRGRQVSHTLGSKV